MPRMELTDIKGAANFLGLSIPTMRQWVSSRKIPYFKAGRLIKFDIADLEAFTRKRRVDATP